MVSWTRSTQPLLLGLPARMKRCRAPWRWTAAPKSFGAELRTVVGGDLTQLPARSGEFARHAVQQLAGVARARVAFGAVQLSPAERRGDVDGRVLPDRALGPAQAADVEAVELDLLARLGRVDVTLGRRQIGLALVGIAMPSDQRQALGAGVQAHAAQHAPHPVLANPDPTPLLAGQLGADPTRPIARVPEREGDDPALEVRPDLVRHPRTPALADVEGLPA